jgi:hypothetical protein
MSVVKQHKAACVTVIGESLGKKMVTDMGQITQPFTGVALKLNVLVQKQLTN